MCAFEVVKDRGTKEEFDAGDGIGAKIANEMTTRGMVMRMRGDVACLAPPIITPETEIDRVVEIAADSVKAVLG